MFDLNLLFFQIEFLEGVEEVVSVGEVVIVSWDLVVVFGEGDVEFGGFWRLCMKLEHTGDVEVVQLLCCYQQDDFRIECELDFLIEVHGVRRFVS